MKINAGIHYTQILSGKWYSLRRVPVLLATLCYVEQGSKLVSIGQHSSLIDQSALLLLPAGHEFEIVNRPVQERYAAQLLSFSSEYLQGFSQRYSGLLESQQDQVQKLCLRLDYRSELKFAWQTLLAATLTPGSAARQIHAADGLLLALHEQGGLQYWLHSPLQDWPQKLEQLFMLQAWQDWTIDQVAAHFGLGASTLRRHLKRQGESFSQILERVRMAIALQRLQTSSLSIAEIAQQVGYLSASRFSHRFRQRYGLMPSQVGRQ